MAPEEGTKTERLIENGRPVVYVDTKAGTTSLTCPLLNITLRAPLPQHILKSPFEQTAYARAELVLSTQKLKDAVGPTGTIREHPQELLVACRRIVDNSPGNL